MGSADRAVVVRLVAKSRRIELEHVGEQDETGFDGMRQDRTPKTKMTDSPVFILSDPVQTCILFKPVPTVLGAKVAGLMVPPAALFL